MARNAKVNLDQQAMDRLLRSREGQVGRVMAGFAGVATREVRAVADERVQRRTGRYRDGITSTMLEDLTVEVRASAPYSSILEKGSRPHVIEPRRPGGVLVFNVGGRKVFARKVNHPGTPAFNILRDGVRRAGERLGEIAGRAR